MGKGRIAPIRPSIAKILKRQIGGFVREYEREVNRPPEPAQPLPPGAQKGEETPPKPEQPQEFRMWSVTLSGSTTQTASRRASSEESRSRQEILRWELAVT